MPVHWGVHEDVYCAGKESTFEFLEGVLKEVISLFPSQYIHIGGDEVRCCLFTCSHSTYCAAQQGSRPRLVNGPKVVNGIM